ncbi:NAD(P)/FAD-dependent oxidoreductase [Aggregatimonas sangjinii]|uniref:NAD(P)/FAD-dependent oxidoreductase n=1 Tax=Aggregatimonas sangjinii TaxID=2583587 RepID=A0A5B7SY31_9FLAO|nr:NAD(P)/FAD-dependent oxidoreductase [Aggregatimonas sangjinii]QCX01650.1 NAD(P)/FAD-dependent oxidoreductase [Aggregatimonas sangjinii]
MRIAIIGGGFMGVVLAHEISKNDAKATIFERDSQLGGLTTYQDYGDFVWDKFYHVITPTDQELVELLQEVGLDKKLHWRRSLTGYYTDKKFYSLSSSKEFLMFPVLGLIDKIRLGYTLFRGAQINDWKSLEKIPVNDWLIKLGGKRTYEKFWAPMLQAKLGENHKKVSAVFIWTYIKRLFRSRSSAAQKEHMGYVTGGYKTIFDRFENLLVEAGSEVLKGRTVTEIKAAQKNGLLVGHDGNFEHFDKVIFTGPLNALEKIVSPELFEISNVERPISYLGAICLVLVTKQSLTPYYVLNIGDNDTPFTGVIGMSSLVDLKETGGKHLTYFPKYIDENDPLWSKSDEELEAYFLKGVYYLYPDLKETDILSAHIHRAFKVQPLQELNFSEMVPRLNTKHPDFYVLNTAQFVNDSVNNNTVVKHVDRFMTAFNKELVGESST